MCIVQCFGKDVCDLEFCLDVLDGDRVVSDEGSEVVILQCDMFGSRTYLRRFNQVDTTFIVLEDGTVNGGSTTGE